MSEKILPTKRQRELLGFIESFIGQHGYSPSYREIMDGTGYTSVATVALHVNSLVMRGHLKKRENSARSLEVIDQPETTVASASVKPSEEKWLVQKIEAHFEQLEESKHIDVKQLDELYVLVGALKVLSLDGAAHALIPRLGALKERVK